MKKRHILTFALGLVLTLSCFVGFSITASATDYTVTTASELFADAEQSGTHTVKLGADIETNRRIVIKGNITLDLNGYKIARQYSSDLTNGEVIYVGSGAVLTIKDTSAAQEGVITGGRGMFGAGGVHIDGGTVYLESGNISGNKSTYMGGGVKLDGSSDSRFYMSGGCISDNFSGRDGGGLHIDNGKAEITGGIFRNNQAKLSGGAIHVDEAYDSETLIVNATKENPVIFEANTIDENAKAGNGTAGNGGAIAIADGKVSINYAFFIYNKTPNDGGAVACHDDDGTSISNCKFTSNSAGASGSAIYVDTDNVKLYDITADTEIRAVGNDIEIGGRFICYTLYLDNDGWNYSRIYIYEDLSLGSSIDITMDDIEEGDTLVYCNGSASAEHNYKYFHVIEEDLRAKADGDEICTVLRNGYVEEITEHGDSHYFDYVADGDMIIQVCERGYICGFYEACAVIEPSAYIWYSRDWVGEQDVIVEEIQDGDLYQTIATKGDATVRTELYAYAKGGYTEIIYFPEPVTGLIADGTPKALVTAGSTSRYRSFSYSLDGVNWSSDIPTVTEGGTYTVYYKIEETDWHYAVSPRSVTVTVDQDYDVTFVTGSTLWSGTFNAVYINIIGDKGETGFVKCEGVYNRKYVDSTTIKAAGVGNIQRFEIKLDSNNEWLLAKATVAGKEFTINTWLEEIGATISVDYNTKAISTVAGETSTGSAFGEGSVWVIVGVSVALLAAAAVTTIVVVKKKKKPAVADSAEESEETEETENE